MNNNNSSNVNRDSSNTVNNNNRRNNNNRNQITGALICRSVLYLQYLEGPNDKIDETYDN